MSIQLLIGFFGKPSDSMYEHMNKSKVSKKMTTKKGIEIFLKRLNTAKRGFLGTKYDLRGTIFGSGASYNHVRNLPV